MLNLCRIRNKDVDSSIKYGILSYTMYLFDNYGTAKCISSPYMGAADLRAGEVSLKFKFNLLVPRILR